MVSANFLMVHLTSCYASYSRALLFKPAPQHFTSHTSLQQSPSHISGHIKVRIIIVLQVIWACWSTRGCVTGIGSPAGGSLAPGRAGQRLRLACDCSPLPGLNEGPASHHLPQGPAPVQAQGVYSANPIESPGKRDQGEREPAGSNGHLKQQQNSSVGSLTLSCPCLGEAHQAPYTSDNIPSIYSLTCTLCWRVLWSLKHFRCTVVCPLPTRQAIYSNSLLVVCFIRWVTIIICIYRMFEYFFLGSLLKQGHMYNTVYVASVQNTLWLSLKLAILRSLVPHPSVRIVGLPWSLSLLCWCVLVRATKSKPARTWLFLLLRLLKPLCCMPNIWPVWHFSRLDLDREGPCWTVNFCKRDRQGSGINNFAQVSMFLTTAAVHKMWATMPSLNIYAKQCFLLKMCCNTHMSQTPHD